MLVLTYFLNFIRAVFVSRLFLSDAWRVLCSVFLFVLLFVCTSVDGTSNYAAVTERSEDEFKKKLAGNYNFL